MNPEKTTESFEPRLPLVATIAALSAFLGGLIALVGMLLFGAYPTLKGLTDYAGAVRFLYNWQTLFGAMLALLAASITVLVIREQTRLSEKAVHEEKAAAQRVATVALAGALSEIVAYSQAHWKSLNRMARGISFSDEIIVEELEFPKPSTDALAQIREVARHPEAGKEHIAYLIAALARRIQYHEARLRSLKSGEWKLDKSFLVALLQTVAEIRAITTELFSYFGESYVDQIINDDKINSAARALSMLEENTEGYILLKEEMESRKDRQSKS